MAVEDTANDNLGPLSSGQTVVVVGGGPAGSSCATMLRRLAARRGVSLRIVLFEAKDFSVERNVCVGVLSPPFQQLLRELELTLPESIIQRRIKGYMLHSGPEKVFLQEQAVNGERTMVVDRTDLDRFFLECVREAGGSVIEEKVVDIEPRPDKVLVVGSGGARVLADAVVGAFGLDESALSIFETRVAGYRRPLSTNSILTEIAINSNLIDERFDDTIHALLIGQMPGAEFGAITPKRNIVTVNIAGEEITDDDLDKFLRLPWSRELLPEATLREVRYYDSFPSRPAQNMYRDRIITIGNSSGLLRPLKGKGINTGIITGITAARTMMEVGISRQAFDEFYRRCHHLTSEFRYGTILRWIYGISFKLDVMDAVLALATRDPLLYRAFYDMVSGEGSYREIIKRSARPPLLAKILVAIARYRILGK